VARLPQIYLGEELFMHIDPANVQLLFVDLQAFLTAYSATESPDMISKVAGTLAARRLSWECRSPSALSGRHRVAAAVHELQGL
jgi:hypothetical protein